MGTLDEVTRMQKEGRNEEEIVKELRQREVSPREIEDALSQSKIKNAVSGGDESNFSNPPSSKEFSSYRPSIKETNGENNSSQYGNEQEYYPQEGYEQEGYSQNSQADSGYEQEYYEQEGYSQNSQADSGYEQEYYPQEGYENYSSTNNTDMIMEVSEQVFSEKTKKIKKQLDELNEFKVIFQTKVESSLERLKKIENIIDRLQSAILEKVGSYGENLTSIKKEMSMMQDSFRKITGGTSTKEKENTPKQDNKGQKKTSKKLKVHSKKNK